LRHVCLLGGGGREGGNGRKLPAAVAGGAVAVAVAVVVEFWIKGPNVPSLSLPSFLRSIPSLPPHSFPLIPSPPYPTPKYTPQECNKDSKDRYLVHYTALVRITHLATGSYREDFGACDSLDRSLGTAVSHALKGAVTDAMKRASRHFGDKLGNSLYDSRFKASMAPTTLRQALDLHDLEYNKRTFFDRDRAGGGTGTSGTGTKVEGGATMGGAAAAAPPGAALPSGKAVAPAPPAALAAAPGPQWRRRQPPSAAAPPALPQQQAWKQAPPPSAWQGLRGSGLCGTGAAGPDPEEADFGGAAFDSALLADVTNAVPPRPSTARGGRPGGTATATATATVMGGGGPMAGRKRPHASAGEGGGRGGGLPPGNPYGAPRQQNV